MKIESLMLENIRSHAKTIIRFTEGFNCLVGGVGAGKSTVLYAIDMALFGEPLGRSYDYLLREGADVGRIALKFIKNGREYTLWRALKRQGERINQDIEQLKLFEGERLIAEMKSDAVAEQLRAITGLDRDIFHELIWIRQEHLKDILDMPPRERQARLDQLFGLSDYETSWINLRPVLGIYEGESISLEHDPDVKGIAEIQSKYDEAVTSLAAKDRELEEAKRKLSEAEIELKEASARLEELESIRKESEKLKAEENELRLKVRTVEDGIVRISFEIEKIRTRIGDLERRLGSLKAQEEANRMKLKEVGLPSNLMVEQIQDYIEGIIDQISSKQGERENAVNEVKRATQRISSLVKENRCPLCLQTLLPEYKEKLLNLLYQELTHNKQMEGELENSIEVFEHTRRVLSSVVSELQVIQSRMGDTSRLIEEEQKRLDDALRELETKKEMEKALKTQLETLRLKAPLFDATNLEEAQRRYKDAFERYSNFKHMAQMLEFQKNDVASRVETLKQRLDIAEKKVERSKKVKQIRELVQEIRQAYRSIQPKLRGEFVTYLERVVQQVLDELIGVEGAMLNVTIDENYTPMIEAEGGIERSVLNLSGGERTFFAFAYRLGIGQMIMQWRSGHGLSMLLLDEPTESLGREDGSIDRLAEALSRLKTVEQVIAVTHSDAFAEKADHVIRFEKRDNQSVVFVER